MRTCLRFSAIALSLLGSIGSIGGAHAQSVSQFQSGSANPGTSEIQGLKLSAAQRATIFRAINQEKAKITPPPPFQPRIGAEAPPSMALYVLPDDALAQIPDGQQYKYTVVQNQVVLVDPTTMRVVDVIRQ
ncbi:MAG: DUF1236 domain-containing protein [Bradyrhizobiaceae bacterium]|nr:DUF1236 domain-containing protein [Bradyrhizobiaceae bacterium]